MNEGNQKIKYWVYARKSTEDKEKQILSNPSQIAELQPLAKNRAVIATRDESQSAKVPGRPVFNEMLDGIEKGKFQGIIVWHPDRLSRNSVDTGRIIYLFDTGKLIEIVTPGQVFRNTPNDKFMLNLFCSTAKLENDNKGVNVKRGLRKKADMGYLPSGAKAGYMNDPYAEKGNKRIKDDPVRFPIVKEMWRLMLTGNYRTPKVVDIANNKLGYLTPKHKRIGGKPMAYSAAYVMFRDPFYYGMFEFPKGSGNWFRGRHTPMVTEEEFMKVQEMLGGTENQRPHIHTFAFTGMIRCGECKCMITAEHKTKRQKNGNTHHYTYYHCTKRKRGERCSQSVVQQNDLESQIIATLDQLDISQEVHEFGMKWMREQNAKDSVNTNMVLTNLQKDYKDCVMVIDGLIDMRAREELNKEDFQRRMEDAQKEKRRLEELLADTGDQIDKRVKFANEAFEFVEHAILKFKTGPWEKKKEILSTLGSNLSLMDKKFSVSLENSLVPMKTVSLVSRDIIARVRTAKNPVTKTEIEQSLARSQSMLRALDEVRTAIQAIRGPSPFAIVHRW